MRLPIELENKQKEYDDKIPIYLELKNKDNNSKPIYIKTNFSYRIPFCIPSVIPAQEIIPSCTCPVQEECEDQNKYEIADIFKQHGEEYHKNHKLTSEQVKVIYAIQNCRTEAYGYHIDICDNCGHSEKAYNSCRNRHCPKCQGISKRKWVQSRIDEILPICYHHATFTVPGEISYFSQYNKKLIYDLLFEASSQTLLEFGQDPKWLGALIGFYGILHTWSQTMWNHIHIHYIVTAGGVLENGEWKEPKYKNKFLFPVKAMAKTFRKKMLNGLQELYNAGSLTMPYDKTELNDPKKFELWLSGFNRTPWVIDSRKPFSGPEDVIKYIGRYTHRTAISNSRIISVENGSVCFKYKDNKEKNKSNKPVWKEMTLSADQFIERFLMHVLPKRYHRIRNFGFLTNSKKNMYIKKIREIFQAEDMLIETVKSENVKDDEYICPNCKQGIMRTFLVVDGANRIVQLNPQAMLPQEEVIDTS